MIALLLILAAPVSNPIDPPPPLMFDVKSNVAWDCDVRDPSGEVSKISGTTHNFKKTKEDYNVDTPDFSAISDIKSSKNLVFDGKFSTSFSQYSSRFVVVVTEGNSYPLTRHSLILRFKGITLPYPKKIDLAIIELSKVYENGTSYTSTSGVGYCSISGFELTPYQSDIGK